MPLWLDKRYVNMVSPKLEQFKWKKPTLANFRCPYCGDSQKNKRKARGYIYTKGNGMFYKCHNCPESTNLANFLKFIDAPLFRQYILESFAEKNKNAPVIEEKSTPPAVAVKSWAGEDTKFGDRLSKLPNEHYAKQYLLNRLIPESAHGDIWYADDIQAFIQENFDPKQEAPKEPALAIMIRDEKGALIGMNARLMKPKDYMSKYCKAKISAEVKLIFGIHRVQKDSKIYVFEGEFDSLFVKNAIAVGGVQNMHGIENVLGVNKQSIIQVVDNDPRRSEVVKAIENLIDDGYSVVLLPGNIEEKDVNEIAMHHKLSSTELKQLLDDNTYSGLSAKLKLASWRKC
jgi:hypothetical protein